MKTKILPLMSYFLLLSFVLMQSCGVTPGDAATPTSVPFSPNNFETVASWNTIEIAPGIFKEGLASAIVFSPDSKYLAVGASGDIGGLGLWDVESGKQIRFFGFGEGLTLTSVSSIAFSPDGKKLVAVDYSSLGVDSEGVKKRIIIWEVESGNELQILTQQFASSVILSPDGKTMASIGGDDEELVLWDLPSGQKTHVWSSEDVPDLVDVEFTPDGATLVLGFHDYTFKLWDVASGKEVRTFGEQYYSNVVNFVLSPDGKLLASSSSNGVFDIWDVSTGERLRTISGHDEVTSYGAKAVFSPDGKMLLSIAEDGVKLWDVASGAERVPRAISGYISGLGTFNNFSSGHDIAIAPNGKYMATTGIGWVLLWKISP